VEECKQQKIDKRDERRDMHQVVDKRDERRDMHQVDLL
jgi:hypothetical protein